MPQRYPVHGFIMKKTEEIFQNYKVLCSYCDNFFKTVMAKHSSSINCHKGCSDCCELESVNALEIYSILRFLKSGPVLTDKNSGDQKCCALLNENYCMIYPARPLICRTHGLLLKSNEFTQPAIHSCMKNFIDTTVIENDYIFDSDRITSNLVKLNYAFCLDIGKSELSSERFPLKCLLSHNLPVSFQNLLDSLP